MLTNKWKNYEKMCSSLEFGTKRSKQNNNYSEEITVCAALESKQRWLVFFAFLSLRIQCVLLIRRRRRRKKIWWSEYKFRMNAKKNFFICIALCTAVNAANLFCWISTRASQTNGKWERSLRKGIVDWKFILLRFCHRPKMRPFPQT